MKYFIFLLLCSSCFARFDAAAQQNVQQKEGYSIGLLFPLYANSKVYLGHFFGSDIIMVDSCILNQKGKGTFSGKQHLEPGIYTLSLQNAESYFDFLISSEEQRFTVSMSAQRGKNSIRFTGSTENNRMLAYKNFMLPVDNIIYEYRHKLEHANDPKEREAYILKLSKQEKTIQRFRDSLIKKYPSSFLSALLLAMKEPSLPKELLIQKTKKDSLTAKAYIKEHYWDGVDFWNGWLLNTPFFEHKLDHYFKEVIEIQTDSIIKAIDDVVIAAQSNEKMYSYLLNRLVMGCESHYFKWNDEVFIHLYQKYFADKKYAWLLQDEGVRLKEKAYFLMGKIIGSAAPDIELPDTRDSIISLYQTKGKYTLICFWDPTCNHCTETLPKIDSVYRQKYRALGLEVFTVATESRMGKPGWLEYLQNNHLTGWNNVYYSNQSDAERMQQGKEPYAKLYDVWFYPSFFVVDHEKKFKAKKMNAESILDFLDSLFKQ